MLLNLGKYKENYCIIVYKTVENSSYGEFKIYLTNGRKGRMVTTCG